MSAVLNEQEAKQNALSAFFDFHRQSTDGTTQIVKMRTVAPTPNIELEIDSFTEKDVQCSQTRGSWRCVIPHLHLSRTRKGMPYVFEYDVKDDPAKAEYHCKPMSPTG